MGSWAETMLQLNKERQSFLIQESETQTWENDGNQRYNQQSRLCTVFYYPFYDSGTLWRYVRKRNIVYPWHFDAMANIMISATMENLLC